MVPGFNVALTSINVHRFWPLFTVRRRNLWWIKVRLCVPFRLCFVMTVLNALKQWSCSKCNTCLVVHFCCNVWSFTTYGKNTTMKITYSVTASTKLLPQPTHGTVYRRLSRHRRHCRLSSDIWRRTCLRPRTDGAARLVSFFVYRTRRRFLCVLRVLAVFLTKCHVNLFVNNNTIIIIIRSVT